MMHRLHNLVRRRVHHQCCANRHVARSQTLSTLLSPGRDGGDVAPPVERSRGSPSRSASSRRNGKIANEKSPTPRSSRERRFFSTHAYHHADDRAPANIIESSAERRLPDGIMRQSDFFGEAVTFVRGLDVDSLGSVHRSSSSSSTAPNDNNSQLENSSRASTASRDDDDDGGVGGDDISDAISSFDGMCLTAISRGSATLQEGNDADGPDARAYHASAQAWAELLRRAGAWNQERKGKPTPMRAAPMLAVAAVAPVAAQCGSGYVRRIDRLLEGTRDAATAASSPPSLWRMAREAVSFRDAVVSTTPESRDSGDDGDSEPMHLLTPRERWHLHALHQLLRDNHADAMGAYLRLLELFPGDLLGLSLALDVAYALGDAESALRAATNVSAYWTERDGGSLRLRRTHPAQNLATSLVSVGLSASPSSSSSRASSAERLAETAMARDADGCGGTSVWALSHSLGSEGRASEMVSKLAGFDGSQHYERCGFLHFLDRMRGYGGLATLDRRGAGCDRTAVRLYDGGFGSVLEYSGNDVEGVEERGGEEACLAERRVPRSMRRDAANAVGSAFAGWFGGGSAGRDPQEGDEVPTERERQGTSPRRRRRTVEDVLCWLPPGPPLLAHATALLFRLTLCEGVPASDDRWADLRVAWTLALQRIDHDTANDNKQTPLEFMPMAMLASSLLIEPGELHYGEVSRTLECAMQGLHRMGMMMELGRSKEPQQKQSNDASHTEEWREVLRLLAQARDVCRWWEMPNGMDSLSYLPADSSPNIRPPDTPIGWNLDLRQFLEHALCHAAAEAGDYESLCLARAVCSEGTTLRPNCPELWWRYGTILDLLGDDVAAENARGASVSLGSGEGGASF